ncbi:hypothetical protein Hanom_Chr12g01147441 [Helianthus anomalus]
MLYKFFKVSNLFKLIRISLTLMSFNILSDSSATAFSMDWLQNMEIVYIAQIIKTLHIAKITVGSVTVSVYIYVCMYIMHEKGI